MKLEDATDPTAPLSPAHVGGGAMQRELLRAEQQRVTVLIVLLGFLLAVIGMLRAVPELIREDIRPRLLVGMGPLAVLIASYLVYEAAMRFWIGRLRRANQSLPRHFRYVNSCIEVSLPTLGILTGSVALDRLTVLGSALPFLYFLFIFLAALNLDFWLCAFAGAVAGLEFLAVSLSFLGSNPAAPGPASPVMSMLMSPHQYLVKGVLLLAGGLCAGFVALQIRCQLTRVLEAMEERNRAIGIVGQHVSPQVAEVLLKQPVNFAGQSRSVCVMFLDIRDFSRLANERSAPDVMDYLNTLFSTMIPVVNEYRGIINKFLGDGFMAVFGAPVDDGEQCRQAIRAAQEILRWVETLNADGRIPPTRVGIGLHVGPAMTGNVGASERKEYTVIGDVVNLASRIEQATKMLGARLLVSEAVAQALGSSNEFKLEDMGPVELKGQATPVRLFKHL